MGFAASDGDFNRKRAVECMKEIDYYRPSCPASVTLQDLNDADIFYVMTDSHKT